MKYIYYPGCSLKSTGKSFEESLTAVFKHMKVDFAELEDWNCCGATNYMSIDESNGMELTSRNIALAEKQACGDECSLIVPCAACYMGLLKTSDYLENDKKIRKEVNESLSKADLSVKAGVKVRHPLDAFVNDIGTDKIKETVSKDLKGLKVASYYGCQITRPISDFDDQRNPQSMEDIVTALGGENIDWPLKTRCCSGSMTSTLPDIGFRLSYLILKEAKDRGADVIVTSCPLCQFNLECFQDKISKKYKEDVKIPVLYFTQLMGEAFGISKKELGLHRMLSPELSLT